MKKVKLFEEFISEKVDMEELQFFLNYYKKKNPGKKVTYTFTKDTPKGYTILVDGKILKESIDEAAEVLHQYDFLGMQAQAANMTREEWIAHYGTPEIGSGIDEGKKSIYTVFFDDKNGMDWDWEVEATSPEEAIKLVQDGKALGPYDQTLPRGARNFSAKLYK